MTPMKENIGMRPRFLFRSLCAMIFVAAAWRPGAVPRCDDGPGIAEEPRPVHVPVGSPRVTPRATPNTPVRKIEPATKKIPARPSSASKSSSSPKSPSSSTRPTPSTKSTPSTKFTRPVKSPAPTPLARPTASPARPSVQPPRIEHPASAKHRAKWPTTSAHDLEPSTSATLESALSSATLEEAPLTSQTLKAGAGPVTPLQRLRGQLTLLFSDPAFANAQWGVMIRSVGPGETLFSLNDEKGFMPASNLKIFTTAAALDRLGPDFQYETNIFFEGTLPPEFTATLPFAAAGGASGAMRPPNGRTSLTLSAPNGRASVSLSGPASGTPGGPTSETLTALTLKDGVLRGSLVVVGSGDPSFSGRFHHGNSLAPLEAWARGLQERGVRKIEGDILLDDSVLDGEAIPEGWSYNYLTDWYAAEIAGLCLNDNCQDICVTAGDKEGEPVRVRVEPPPAYGEIVVSAVTAPARAHSALSFRRDPAGNTIEVFGRLALDAKPCREAVTVHNPTLFFGHHLAAALARAGIELKGAVRDLDDLDQRPLPPGNRTLLATYASPPLAEIIKRTNKDSQNLYAEQILRTLGARRGGAGGVEEGFRAAKAFLERNKINSKGFQMVDGSGLSRLNLMQPRQAVGLLEAMTRHPAFQAFYDSLPVAGVDGSMNGRMRRSRAGGNLRAKTGSIKGVVALSGYVSTRDGELLAFSMIANNFTVPEAMAKRVIDRACECLAEFSR